MKIGFTGTRNGMFAEQENSIWKFLVDNNKSIKEVHHGDCIGSDSDFHKICIGLKLPIYIHPPLNEKYRAFCFCDGVDTTKITLLPPKGYIERNHDIVNSSAILLATPDSFSEQLRSGTWATIRYAVNSGKSVKIFYPDGTMFSALTGDNNDNDK